MRNSNAHIHNCSVGSDVIISNIGDYIANYNIEDNVIIKDCGRIHTEGNRLSGMEQRLPFSMRPEEELSGSGTIYPHMKLI